MVVLEGLFYLLELASILHDICSFFVWLYVTVRGVVVEPLLDRGCRQASLALGSRRFLSREEKRQRIRRLYGLEPYSVAVEPRATGREAGDAGGPSLRFSPSVPGPEARLSRDELNQKVRWLYNLDRPPAAQEPDAIRWHGGEDAKNRYTPPVPGPGTRLSREEMRERVRRLYEFQSYEAWKRRSSG
jgi:hypothetical protein